MTKEEYSKLTKKELNKYKHHRQAALDFFAPLIEEMRKERPGARIALHHIEENDEQYELWDTVVPLYVSEHMELHNTGREKADETRAKISKWRKLNQFGDKNPAYGLLKDHNGAKNPMYGKQHSEATRKKLSEARRQYYERLKAA